MGNVLVQLNLHGCDRLEICELLASISSTRTIKRPKQKNSHVDEILTDLEPLIKLETNTN